MPRSAFWPGCLGPATRSAREQDGLDGVTAQDVDEVIDGAPGVLEQVEHGQEELAVPSEDLGRAPGIERGEAAGVENDVLGLRHRWWLLCKSL